MKWFPFKSGVPYTCKDCPALAEVSESKIPSLGERMTTYMDMKAQMTALALEAQMWRRIATKLVDGAEQQIDELRGVEKPTNEHWLAAWKEYDEAVGG